MYFEIYRNGNLIKRGTKVLGGLSWENALMTVPSMDLNLPVEYLEYFGQREEVKVYVNGKVFYGVVVGHPVEKDAETITVKLNHVIHEWTYRQISVNNAIKMENLNVIYKGAEVETNGTVSISANPFNILKGETLTTAQYAERAGAVAWYNNGDRVEIESCTLEPKPDDEGNIPEDPTTYTATFTAQGVSVTVDATVVEELEEDYSTTDPSIIDELTDIYADNNFAYPGWAIKFSDKAKEATIDYVYSRQNKLEALTTTVELTEDLYWRVGNNAEKVLEIGEFGDERELILSLKPSGRFNVRIVTEPSIETLYESVVNLATVYSEKSDSGMSSLTLREVYNDPSLQDEAFPVVILRTNVNNSRDYSDYITQYPTLAPNNELEYAVLDTESIAIEGGTILEGTFAFNDLSPFNDMDEEEVTDEDRIEAAKTAYKAAIRKLKNARRRTTIDIVTEQLPADLNVGDKVRLLYDNSVLIEAACSNYMKKILSENDWYYVTNIGYQVNDDGSEVDSVTLEKFLHSEREVND